MEAGVQFILSVVLPLVVSAFVQGAGLLLKRREVHNTLEDSAVARWEKLCNEFQEAHERDVMERERLQSRIADAEKRIAELEAELRETKSAWSRERAALQEELERVRAERDEYRRQLEELGAMPCR